MQKLTDQSSAQPTEASNASNNQLEMKKRRLLVEKCARVLFLAYPKNDYDDPDGAFATFARVLEDYSDFVIRYVSDPKTGIQRHCKFPPRIAELVERCDYIVKYIEIARPNNAAREIRQRLNAPIDRSERPTPEQLREKYGEKWGLTSTIKKPIEFELPTPEKIAATLQFYKDHPERGERLKVAADQRLSPRQTIDNYGDQGS